jgi:flagellar biosynthesis protein FlhG
MARVISFSSGKGGVGKTSLVANLGCLYAGNGKKVLLIDGDWSLGKLAITLGVRPKFTIDKVLRGEVGLNDSIEKVRDGLGLLAAPSGRIGFEELDEATRNGLFFQLDQLSNGHDLILLDHSSGIHWGVLQFAAAAHQHVIVTTGEPTSYTDAYAIMKMLSKRFGVRRFGLLVTMSENQVETEKVISRFTDVVESQLGVLLSVIDIIPWEQKMAESIRHQQPFVERYPNHDVTRRFKRICSELERFPLNISAGLQFFRSSQTPITMGQP